MPIFLHINKARFFQKIYKKKLLPVTRENIKFKVRLSFFLRKKMKVGLFMIILILKTFLISQMGVEAGPLSKCQTDNDCQKPFTCLIDESKGSGVCLNMG